MATPFFYFSNPPGEELIPIIAILLSATRYQYQ